MSAALTSPRHLLILRRQLEKVIYLLVNPPADHLQFIVDGMVAAYVKALHELEETQRI